MLTFLSPLFLAGSVAVAIPIVLHLLKREPQPKVKFAAVKLLKQAPIEHSEKHRLRELLLLALRIATLLLLALAFARPFFPSGEAIASTNATIVALDTSYSMSAPGKFDRARQLAKEAIGRAPSGDLVGVVTFSDGADVIARPSADRALAISAIDGTTAGFGATRYRAGLNTAAHALDRRRGTIVVVTDLQENGWDAGDRASVPDSAQIEVVDAGAGTDNLALTGVRAAGDRIIATIRNAGGRARDTRVRLTVDGRSAGETTVSVGPNQTAEATLAAARGEAATVTIDDPDGVQADNTRYLVLDNAARPSLLIVTGTGDLDREGFYVQQALAAGTPDGQMFDIVGVSGAQLSGWSAERLMPQAAVLVLSTRGLERRGREAMAAYVKGGGGLLVAAGPDVDGEVVGDVLGPGTPLRVIAPASTNPDREDGPTALAPADVRHPIFQTFGASAASLGLVKFHTVVRISGPGCQTLARFTTGEAALVECASGEGRALLVASDLNNRWNDFPLHATFVPFLHEAVRYLSSARPHAGDYLVSEVPGGMAPQPGIVNVVQSDRPRRVAVNVDPRESEPGRISIDEFQSAVTRLKDVGATEARVEATEQEDRQHLWQYVLMFMFAVLAVEGTIASRTA